MLSKKCQMIRKLQEVNSIKHQIESYLKHPIWETNVANLFSTHLLETIMSYAYNIDTCISCANVYLMDSYECDECQKKRSANFYFLLV